MVVGGGGEEGNARQNLRWTDWLERDEIGATYLMQKRRGRRKRKLGLGGGGGLRVPLHVGNYFIILHAH